MRLACAIALLLTLAACQREQTFDERFAETSSRLEAKAGAIERELAVSASEAGAAEAIDSVGPESANGTPRAVER
jgi:hypothetical protein